MATAAFSIATSTGRVCNYLMGGFAHDGSGERRFAYAGGVGGMIPSIAAGQFAATRRRYGKQDAKRQGATGYISFSREELDPDDPDAGIKALRIAQETVARMYPGHPGICVVQRDGKSGLWHAHFLVSAISDRAIEHVYRRKPKPGEPCDGDGLVGAREQRKAGRSFSSAMTNAWRLAHVVDSVLADNAFMTSIGAHAYDNEQLMHERRRNNAERVTAAEQVEKAAGNDWRENLREAVAAARADAASLEEFRDALAVRRVELRVRKGRFGADFGDGVPVNFSYSIHDVEGKRRNARAGGRDGVGDECGSAATLAIIERNRRQFQSAAATPSSPDPVQVQLTALTEEERLRLIASVRVSPALAQYGQRVGSALEMTLVDPTLQQAEATLAISAWEAAGCPETTVERLARERTEEGAHAADVEHPIPPDAGGIESATFRPLRNLAGGDPQAAAIPIELTPPELPGLDRQVRQVRQNRATRKARTPAHLRYLEERTGQISKEKEFGD